MTMSLRMGAHRQPDDHDEWATWALDGVAHRPFWTDRSDAPPVNPLLSEDTEADVLVIGGGLTGLWAAILAAEEASGRRIVLIESERIAHGASGRNGGFISSSLTHGLAHGEALWPREMPTLVRLGGENLQEITSFLRDEDIDADLRICGKTAIATTDHALRGLGTLSSIHRRWNEDCEVLDKDAMQADVASPTYLGGLRIRGASGLMDPARMTWGLQRAALRRGVQIYEQTPAMSLAADRQVVRVQTPHGGIHARQVVLATNGYRPLLARLRRRILPVFDHVLVTEPIAESDMARVGWSEQQGLTDLGNQFHYYRRIGTRILWGGYDAIYYRGNRTDPTLEHRDASHHLLARQFRETFPQLSDVRFSHKWAGIIDSTSRFTPAIGHCGHGRVGYAVGFTGLGTASSRFAAQTVLDLLAGRDTERTRLTMVRRKPFPFPSEPVRYPLVQFTRGRLAREDRTGRRGAWLRLLDSLGLGFNS